MGKQTVGKQVVQIDRVIIRFAGDSGDGMQLTGDRFTNETALLGNDLATLPDFPAEIRAPAGTLPGVSAFQLHFADHDIMTPGDAPNVLVAMNPAALKANLPDLPRGVGPHRQHRRVHQAKPPACELRRESHRGRFTGRLPRPCDPAHLDDGRGTQGRRGHARRRRSGPRTCSPSGSCAGSTTVRPKERSSSSTKKFADKPHLLRANTIAFEAGWSFGETTEDFSVSYEIKPAPVRPARYRNISGNLAMAYGLLAASWRSSLPLFLGSYPITPASDILHELSKHKRFGIRTFQAEDEIAGVGAALGAAFGGHLGVTTTSGPGLALKAETVGLAVSLELPLVVCNIQRGGPSTGLPTKTEQSDLLQALFGRNGEAPVPVVAPRSPSDCFDAVVDAVRIAITYRTPVIVLSDGYLANGSEPWRLPDLDALPTIDPAFSTSPNHSADDGSDEFWPYLRDPTTLARAWATPGTAGPRAPSRRPREARRQWQHLVRPGQPRSDGSHEAGESRSSRCLDSSLGG